MRLLTKTVAPGEWVTVETGASVRGFPTVTIGGVVQTALVEADTRLTVRCPDLPPGTHAIQVDDGPRWALTVAG